MIIKSTEDIILRFYEGHINLYTYRLTHYKGTSLIYMEVFDDEMLAVEAFEVRVKKQKENNVSST